MKIVADHLKVDVIRSVILQVFSQSSMATACDMDGRIRKVRFLFEEGRLMRSFLHHQLLATRHELSLQLPKSGQLRHKQQPESAKQVASSHPRSDWPAQLEELLPARF